mgnify:CR=1 FL=1|jgi:hypothetical protein
MIEFIYLLWFLVTIGMTCFSFVLIVNAYHVNFADKEYAFLSIIVTLVCFVSWYGLYNSIPQGII